MALASMTSLGRSPCISLMWERFCSGCCIQGRQGADRAGNESGRGGSQGRRGAEEGTRLMQRAPEACDRSEALGGLRLLAVLVV